MESYLRNNPPVRWSLLLLLLLSLLLEIVLISNKLVDNLALQPENQGNAENILPWPSASPSASPLPLPSPLPSRSPLPSPSPSPSPQPTPTTGVSLTCVVRSPVSLDVRRQPSITAETITTLAPDTRLSAVGRHGEGSWLLVQTSKGLGWVSSKDKGSNEELLLECEGNLLTLPEGSPELVAQLQITPSLESVVSEATAIPTAPPTATATPTPTSTATQAQTQTPTFIATTTPSTILEPTWTPSPNIIPPSPSPNVASPSPNVASPSPNVASPSPTVALPTLNVARPINNGANLQAARRTFDITVDGQLSEWANVRGIDINNYVSPSQNYTGPQDLSGNVRAAWDDQYLYLAAEVTDDNIVQESQGDQLHNGDGIELFWDGNLAEDFEVNSYNGDDVQIVFTPGSLVNNESNLYYVHHSGSGNNGQGIEVWSWQTATGYNIEIRIPWSVLAVTPQSGATFGYAIALSDNDTPGSGEQETQIATTINPPRQQPTAWSNFILDP
ncbi:MAG: sugar-binding protein [Ardenticatenaceae bacterium]